MEHETLESPVSENKSATPDTGIHEKKRTEKSTQKKSAKKELVVMFHFSIWLVLNEFKLNVMPMCTVHTLPFSSVLVKILCQLVWQMLVKRLMHFWPLLLLPSSILFFATSMSLR